MEDEMEMLLALYPAISIATAESSASSSSITLTLDHLSFNGLRATLHVQVGDKSAYPAESRPLATIPSGLLSSEDETKLLQRINQQVVLEDYAEDYCLLAVFGTFVSFINDELSVDCGVCLDATDYSQGDFYITSSCRHVFHASCFHSWAEQCLTNQSEHADAELSRTRRRQKQSVAESELKMAQLRIDNLLAEQTRHQARKLMLADKASSLVPAAVRNLDRDKDDGELVDQAEAVKRLDLVTKQLKQSASEIAAVRKQAQACEANLHATLSQLQREEAQGNAQRTVPCPACRTACRITTQ